MFELLLDVMGRTCEIPTLLAPEPKQMIMGNLSDIPRVLLALSWNGTTK